MEQNIILMTDSYKVSHYRQYPPDTRHVYSYFESRGGAFTTTTFFGLQYFLKRYLEGRVVTREGIEYAAKRIVLHFGSDKHFNRAGWEHILSQHDGRLPIRIKAIPEGTEVPTGNVLMTVENTDPAAFWLTNYVETLLTHIWYPITVATQSRAMRRLVLQYLEQTGDPSLVDYKVHDFGFRGVSSMETAGIGGMAHLLSFKGTDTFEALEYATEYYGEEMAGVSIPAAEHSTITSWGKDGETDAYRNMLQAYPDGLVAVVSDSYDLYAACRDIWGTTLRTQVLSRDGVLIIRPDSGYPPEVVIHVLEILGQAFGYTMNSKGYKVLNPHVRIIQGDGIDYAMLGLIMEAMVKAGWSIDNIAFGSGGGLLQKLNRDTLNFAFKCSAVNRGGVWQDVCKDPKTGHSKRSKPGQLALVKNDVGFYTLRKNEARSLGLTDQLVPFFENGTVLRDDTFSVIRLRAA